MQMNFSIIPYSIANTSISKQKETPKQPETLVIINIIIFNYNYNQLLK
jgi:hypothetical protein